MIQESGDKESVGGASSANSEDIRRALAECLAKPFTEVAIDLTDRTWNVSQVPVMPGWYYIETTTPVFVMQSVTAPPITYMNSDGRQLKTMNYNIRARALRINGSKSQWAWMTTKVYSGMAQNLRARAREHTFAHPGTAGLALANYPELHEYDWKFCYLTSEQFDPGAASDKILLCLGEQIWRARNGWPILCAG